MKAIAQFILGILRYCGIDVYKMYLRHLVRHMWTNAIPTKGNPRTDGLCLAFDIFQLTSLSQAGRDFADKLKGTSIPIELFDTEIRPFKPTYISEDEKQPYRNIQTHTIHQKAIFSFSIPPLVKSPLRTNVVVPFWEFESGMIEVFPDLFQGSEYVISTSRFCERYFKRIAPKEVNVLYVRYPFPLAKGKSRDRKTTRATYGIPSDSFVVIFNFSYSSCYERKNPEAVIDAFARAFNASDNARLVIKTAHAAINSEKAALLEQKIKSLDIGDRVILIENHMPHDDLLSLFASSDVYTSLHRGEGLGLGMLEAMSVGTPVICTNYGGNADFCTQDTAFLVNYKRVPIQTDIKRYRYVKEWAEPDVNQAALYLRQVYVHPDLGRQKAEAATSFINDFYSIENFEKDVKSALAIISNRN